MIKMIRPMLWHIYEKDTGCTLTWNEAAIEFDSYEEAEEAAKAWELENYIIKYDIFYYDDGYKNFKEITFDE